MSPSTPFTILIVDDNANNRFTLQTLLQQLPGCLVVEAESGEEALARTVEGQVHLILLDVQMPGMDGYETARHLRMTGRTRDIPVIFVTAVFKSEEFIRRGYAVGAVDYLTKPIDENLLLNRIDGYRKLHERERHLAEALEQLRQREERLNYALEAAQDGIWDWDLTAGTLFLSPRFEAMFGYSQAALPRTMDGIHAYTHPDDLGRMQALLDALSEGEREMAALECRFRRADDSWAWVLLRAKVVRRGRDGRALRIVGANADISRRVADEEALRQAKREAEAANRAKSVFLANMSHELRTPLNAILGFAQILEGDERIPGDERANLHTITRSGRHLLSVINDVLEISRIEAGHLAASYESCDLYDLMDSLVEVMRPRAQEGGLELQYEQGSGLPRYVMADVGKTRQILSNLLTNAIKYTRAGTVTLRADGRPREGRTELLFEVADTGIGIQAEDLERVFLPFFQTDQGASQGEGTGLGLAISREYAQLLGGNLVVESLPGQGSVFHFTTPVELAEPFKGQDRVARRVVGLSPGGHPPSILVAEDDPDNQRLIGELLGRVGFEVEIVGDGRRAVEAFGAHHPDLLFMDMRMPVMSGFEATRTIRALPEGGEIPILALTASAFKEDQGEILAAGCNAVLRKPIEADLLFEVIHRHLGVDYLYAEGESVEGSAMGEEPVSLAGVSAELRAALSEAATILDLEESRRVISLIGEGAPELARRLEELVASYRFDRIISLCE